MTMRQIQIKRNYFETLTQLHAANMQANEIAFVKETEVFYKSDGSKVTPINQSLSFIVEDQIAMVTSTPSSPTVGQRYITTDAGNIGGIVVAVNDIIEYDGSDWFKITPTEGYIIYDKSENNIFGFDGTNWTNLGENTLSAIKVDSSSGSITNYLPSSTNTGKVKLYVNVNIDNSAAIGVQNGETLNGVLNSGFPGTVFSFSNYPVGTQFRADEVDGGWVISVVGSVQSKSLEYARIETSGNGTIAVTGIEVFEDFNTSILDSTGEMNDLDNNGIIAPTSGLYRLSGGMNLGDLDDDNIGIGFRVNGTDVYQQDGLNSTDDGNNSASDVTSISMLFQVSAGDLIQLICESDNEGATYSHAYLEIQRQPSEEVVMAGMVKPAPLSAARFSLSNDSTATSICPFDTTDYNEDTSKFILESSGGITVQPGRYLVNVKPSRQGGLLDWELWNATSNFQVMNGRMDHAQSIDNTDHATGYININAPSEIQLRELNNDFNLTWNGTNDLYGCTIEFVEQPSSTVVMSDSLTVEDLSFGTAFISGTGVGQSIAPINSLSSESYGLTATGSGVTVAKAGKYFLTPHASLTGVSQDIELKVNGTTIYIFYEGTITSDARGVTAQLSAGDIITLETTPAADWSIGSGISTDANATRIGVIPVAGKSVINASEIEVNDQASSGYMEVGGFLYQQGRATTDGTGQVSITYPTPFADTTYSLVCTAANGANVSIMYVGDTTTGAQVIARDSAGGAVSTSFSWIAIGIKP